MGAGYSLSLEKKRVRRQQASIPASLPNFLEYESAGSFHNETMCFYMEASSVPKNGDLIFEVSWERGEKKANGVQTKFIVTVVDPKMMNYGDVQFYQVYTRKIVKGDEDDVTISRRSF
jgi:hypothetical protein